MGKILFINHSRGLHGAEAVFLRSIRVAKDAGHACYVLVPSIVEDEGFDAAAAAIIGNENILHLPYRAYGYGFVRSQAVKLYNLSAITSIVRFVRNAQIDVIYSNTSITCIGAIVAKCTGIRHIWHLHEPIDAMYGWTARMKNWYRGLMSIANNCCIFISAKQRQQWEEAVETNLPGVVVYNPIKQVVPVERGDHQNIVFGYLGTFDPRKNIRTLVHAFGEVRKRVPNAKLLICGAVSEAECHQYSGVGIEVRMHTSNVSGFFAEIDVLVLPSWSETMPLVILEAIENGVATIQTTESGLSEILMNEMDTYFVRPDDEKQWVDRMIQLCDASQREEMVNSGMSTVAAHNFNAKFEQSIRNILCE